MQRFQELLHMHEQHLWSRKKKKCRKNTCGGVSEIGVQIEPHNNAKLRKANKTVNWKANQKESSPVDNQTPKANPLELFQYTKIRLNAYLPDRLGYFPSREHEQQSLEACQTPESFGVGAVAKRTRTTGATWTMTTLISSWRHGRPLHLSKFMTLPTFAW